ncbi:hypothetical protein [Histidinibacterium aquaticum]|uniref:Uncharacterized protein n=1 Tax=Histidinibacterium aquaticum TaxID=2613962 RepID=A0A5J5GKQ3_9RHOB|nr:hypothetical protein [Histidinibacterium aquaticum]KAA9008124.1 hypothetical protein F3S47_11510 [Histidinibacterium aquaticum]
MADPSILNPHPPGFERFLYASVGEDRNGYAVTVLSTLARLGLDPWNETSELVTLGRDGARARLGALLARFRDVPALASDHGRVARDLSHLLPDRPVSGTLKRSVAPAEGGQPGTSGVIWAVLAITFVLFQVLTFGGSGAGE